MRLSDHRVLVFCRLTANIPSFASQVNTGGIETSAASYFHYSSSHQNEAWARGLNPLLAKLVDTSVT